MLNYFYKKSNKNNNIQIKEKLKKQRRALKVLKKFEKYSKLLKQIKYELATLSKLKVILTGLIKQGL